MSSYLYCVVRLQSNAGFVLWSRNFFLIQICDLVLGLFFLSRPDIFIQSSSYPRDPMPVLNKEKKRFVN